MSVMWLGRVHFDSEGSCADHRHASRPNRERTDTVVKLRKPWHSGTYATRRRALFRTIRPESTCWRCGLLLDQHQPHKDGRLAFWTAGHVIDSDVTSPLALEASTCNFKHGGKLRHVLARRGNGNPTSRRWLDPEPMRRP
jgi:hypothetical protein